MIELNICYFPFVVKFLKFIAFGADEALNLSRLLFPKCINRWAHGKDRAIA